MAAHEGVLGLSTPYDEVAYEGHAFPQTHPDRLAVQATLFGLRPAPPSRCRVLELGCGDGGNLIPMALELPGSEFVGVDLAAEPVARGRALAADLGAADVRMLQGDIAALPDNLGTFDYVIAHGVYSWIPPEPRDALLAACRALLNPDGVAFVSYNAYPGSYLRDTARDILRFHVDGIEDPRERMDQAGTIMELIIRAGRTSPHARALSEHMAAILARPRWVVFHDELGTVNTPVYFHEFAAHAARHGLQYLAEAHLADSLLPDLPQEVADGLDALPGDAIVREQYIDFLLNRLFRQTLLCHGEAGVRRVLRPLDLDGMWIAAELRREDGDGGARFVRPEGTGIETADEQMVEVLDRLARAWPAAIRLADLAPTGRGRLAEALLEAHAQRLVDLHVHPPPARRAGERPLAPALARRQAAGGEAILTTLRHESVQIADERARALLALLDGTRDRQALAAALGIEPSELDGALAELARLSLIAA
ncbi:MAG: methyltransferase regulatory domain-containing protein [Solirubrobacteraceae bacterium]